MKRRTILASGVLALAGCLERSSTPGQDARSPTPDSEPTPESTPDSEPTPEPTPDSEPTPEPTATTPGDRADDGYPPPFDETPDRRNVDPSSFETVERDGVSVPLVPVDVAHYWYRRREARFADARGQGQYEQSHVYGAVSSPAPDGGESDPIDDWPRADRVVCYCGCPHHLSSIRAANLLKNGFENVYVIDEGFWGWHDREYQVAGSDVESQPEASVIRGRTARTHAGRSAWAVHEATHQREATAIDPDGTYELEVRFAGVTPDSIVTVRTPGYTVEARLGDLTTGTVTAARVVPDGPSD